MTFLPGKLPKLPQTSGKTPVGARPKRVSQTPQQAAAAAAAKLLAPQYAQASSDAARQNAAIKSFTTALMQQLASTAPAIQNDYNSQVNAQQGMVNAAANSLRAVNPTGDVANLLNAVGAPQSQQDQIAGNLNNTFNGGAAVGQYVNGVLPLDTLRSQGLTATTLASLQPGFTALKGQQNLLTALSQQKDARMKIAEQTPQLEQAWLSQFHTNQNQKQQLALEAQAAGLKVQKQSFDQNLAVTKLRQQQNEFIAKQAAKTASDQKPNNSLSRTAGYIVDSNGNPILVNGKRQILPGFSVNAQGRVVKTKKVPAAGKSAVDFPSLTKTQVIGLRAGMAKAKNGGTDKNEKPIPAISYREAIARAITAGYSRADATKMANRFYPPGVGGRPSKAVRDQNRRSSGGRKNMGPPNPNG